MGQAWSVRALHVPHALQTWDQDWPVWSAGCNAWAQSVRGVKQPSLGEEGNLREAWPGASW